MGRRRVESGDANLARQYRAAPLSVNPDSAFFY